MRLKQLLESHRFIVDGAARTGNIQIAAWEQSAEKGHQGEIIVMWMVLDSSIHN
jgi:hypothetical protein